MAATPGPVHSEGAAQPHGVDATLEAWRAQGGDRLDPVRFRFIEAMARRAAAHEGEARRRLDERLAGLLASYGKASAQAAPSSEAPTEAPVVQQAAQRDKAHGPLAGLAEHIGRHGGSQSDGVQKSLEFFRATWTRLSAERRLTQSLAKVPQNAGPLNSHNLVHQALVLMRELSPGYLNHFMAHVDALLWLEQANAPASAEAPRNEGAKKGARGKAAG